MLECPSSPFLLCLDFRVLYYFISFFFLLECLFSKTRQTLFGQRIRVVMTYKVKCKYSQNQLYGMIDMYTTQQVQQYYVLKKILNNKGKKTKKGSDFQRSCVCSVIAQSPFKKVFQDKSFWMKGSYREKGMCVYVYLHCLLATKN